MTLNRLAVHGWSWICSLLERSEAGAFSGDVAPVCPFTPELKVALVKQSSYCDLYRNPAARTPMELLQSSIHRTGPIGLFINFKASFLIVHTESDEECRIWEEKLAYETPGSERALRFPQYRQEQEAVAVAADSVDWNQFDLVIAIENAVPSRITLRYPSVLWCTLLEHHRLQPYRSYLRQPPKGYDVFLNLRFGPNPQSLRRRPHVVDFPYGLNDVNGLAALFRDVPQLSSLVLLEDHQPVGELQARLAAKGLTAVLPGPSSGSLVAYLERLAAVRCLLVPHSKRPLGGLASIDAAAMDVLVIGNRRQCWNPFIYLPELQASSEEGAVRLVERVLVDDSLRESLIAAQRKRLHWFAWVRPLRQLLAAARQVDRPLALFKQAITA